MTSNRRNWAVFLAAVAVTGLTSTAFLALGGNTDDNLRITLRLSGRIAFIVLLVIFVARPLQQMFTTPFTAKLLRNRRLLGITFAGIHTAHLGLIIYRARLNPDFELMVANNIPGTLTYVMMFVMFATSFNATTRMLGPRNWRILHKIGLYWLFVGFTQTQLPDSVNELNGMNWFLVGLIFAALIIRLTAYLAKNIRG